MTPLVFPQRLRNHRSYISRRASTRLLQFVLGLATLIAASSFGTAAPAQRPNVLLILADNWAWPNAGALGDPLAHTPAFDRIAREGVVFTHTFNPVPSCSPTRSCLLTGRIAHQLGERASLWSAFPKDSPVMTEILKAAGYEIGYSGKPWGPGNHEISGWKDNPVGPKYASFEEFLSHSGSANPFFFWLGNTDTATKGGRLPFLDKATAVIKASQIVVPPELPDAPETRRDLLNYYGGVMSLDETAAHAIALLEKSGQLDNTVVIYTSDNGWQMPRGLANCYDSGSRVPLAIRWGAHLRHGRRVDQFVNVAELGPTILELCGVPPPASMTLHSVRNLLLGLPDSTPRDAAFIERERHANVRHDNLSYPIRAIRTRDFLYIRNLRPDRWPAGDPDVLFVHGRPYGDVDTTLTKDLLLRHLKDPGYARYISLIFDKRPAEELYDLSKDPHQIVNVAGLPAYENQQAALRQRLDRWMNETHDPRVDPGYDAWDFYPYYGKPPKLD